jgi:hypothetical protein
MGEWLSRLLMHRSLLQNRSETFAVHDTTSATGAPTRCRS